MIMVHVLNKNTSGSNGFRFFVSDILTYKQCIIKKINSYDNAEQSSRIQVFFTNHLSVLLCYFEKLASIIFFKSILFMGFCPNNKETLDSITFTVR